MLSKMVAEIDQMLKMHVTILPSAFEAAVLHVQKDIYATGILSGKPHIALHEVREFYERLIVLLIEVRNFESAGYYFSLLALVYGNPLSKASPSVYYTKMLSLYLLFLYTNREHESFNLAVAALDSEIQSSPEIRSLLDFEQLIEAGNYQRGVEVIKGISPSHAILIERLLLERRRQACLMLESGNLPIGINQLSMELGVANSEDLKTTILLIEDMYQKGDINWHVIDENIVRRFTIKGSEKQHAIIKDTIKLIRISEK